jgi:hypothetical protein
MLEFAIIIKDLNKKRNNQKKLRIINIIINWLNELNNFPTMEEKLNLIKRIKIDI